MNISAPNWYKYLYIFQRIPNTVPTDILYDLAYECPKPIQYLKLLIYDFRKQERLLKLLSRTKKDKEKDIKWYKSLTDSNKDFLV